MIFLLINLIAGVASILVIVIFVVTKRARKNTNVSNRMRAAKKSIRQILKRELRYESDL
jgi:hypothetical protein